MTIYNDTMSDGVLIDGTAGVVQQFSVDLQVYYAVNEEIESEIEEQTDLIGGRLNLFSLEYIS